MLRANLIETLATGLLAHAGCILTCFGTAATSMQGCRTQLVGGGALSYFWSQLWMVGPGLVCVGLYLYYSSAKMRATILLALTGSLFVATAAPAAAFALQALFLIQLTLGLLTKFTSLKSPQGCCRVPAS